MATGRSVLLGGLGWAALADLYALVDVDFLDFGCSSGSSIKYAKGRFGVERGVGIDIDPAKVAKTRELGFEAIEADASALKFPPKSVSFCIMSHFLEHLPGLKVAQKCISSACRVSRDFVYIKHPWFDADFDLWKLGYKFYWSDWGGHTLHMGVAQLDSLLRRSKLKQWDMYGVKPVTALNDQAIIARDAPMNSGPTPNDRPPTPLGFTAYREVSVLIRTGTEEAFERVRQNLARDHVLLGGEPHSAKLPDTAIPAPA